MQTTNPFELILSRIEQLQISVDSLAENRKHPDPAKEDSPDRLLDLPEVALLLKKPVGTVRYYIHHRNLPAVKMGKNYVIKQSELLQWVEEFYKRKGGSPDPQAPMLANRRRYQKS